MKAFFTNFGQHKKYIENKVIDTVTSRQWMHFDLALKRSKNVKSQAN